MTGPNDLLDGARTIVETSELKTRGWWGRGAAILCRQALEMAVAQLLSPRGTDPARAPFTVQLISLPEVVDAELAVRVWATWCSLSSATHFQGYELPPTAAEVRSWMAVVAQLLDEADLQRKDGRDSSS